MSTFNPLVWSTEKVPINQKFSFWREAVCEAFLDLDVSCDSPGHFHGLIDSREVGKIRLNRVSAQQQFVRRSASSLGNLDKECFYINFQVDGLGVIKQRGREAEINPGQWYVLDSTEPFLLAYDNRFSSYNFEVSFDLLGGAVASLREVTGRTLGLHQGLECYISEYARGLSRHVDQLDIVRQEKIFSGFLEMLISCLVDSESWSALSGAARARREQIKRYIEENIENPDLGPSTIIKACNISLSTLHAAFSEKNSSVMRYVLAKRLELAHSRLKSTAYRESSISEIAYGCGFSDLSHFCHGFKARFGETPRSTRLRGA